MSSSVLIRLGGLAAIVGGVAYANLGLVVWYLQCSSNIRGLQLIFSVFSIPMVAGAMGAMASLHVLHRREFHGMAQTRVSLVTFVAMAPILVGGLGDALRLLLRDEDALWHYAPLLWGAALAAFGIMALAVVSIAARVLP